MMAEDEIVQALYDEYQRVKAGEVVDLTKYGEDAPRMRTMLDTVISYFRAKSKAKA